MLAFQRLPNGAWVIRRWSIRMPIPLVRSRQRFEAGTLVQGPVDTLGVGGYREEGGWVAVVLSASGAVVATYPDEP